MVPGFKVLSVTVRYQMNEQIHTLYKSALVQSVCMDIDLIETIVGLTFERNNIEQLPEHHAWQQPPNNS